MTKAGCKHHATTGNPDTKTASIRRKHPQLYGSRSGPGHSQRFGSDLQLLLLAIILLQLQQFASAAPTAQPDRDATDATVATTPTTAATDATELAPMGGDNSFISYKKYFHNELNKSNLEWQNPCGGDWTGKPPMPKPSSPATRCRLRKKVLRDLQKYTGRELKDLRADDKRKRNSSTLAIDSSHVSIWAHYNASYEYLPHPSINASQVTLRQMHRHMQFYVAAFARTRRAQLQEDFAKQTESPVSAELLGLVKNSRLVLCYIETANNETIRLNPRLLGRSKHLGFSEGEMEQQLKRFNNYNKLDKIFLKYHYIQYLKQMTQVLAKQRKKKCPSQKTTHKSQGQDGANHTAKRKKLATKKKQKQSA